MRNAIEELIFSDVSSYDIYVNTGVNQGLVGDIKDGYLTIDSIPYIDAERLYYYSFERKALVTSWFLTNSHNVELACSQRVIEGKIDTLYTPKI